MINFGDRTRPDDFISIWVGMINDKNIYFEISKSLFRGPKFNNLKMKKIIEYKIFITLFGKC